MANTKKYVSFDKLSLYDEKIKKVITDGDAASLQSAKDYADGLATNYDAAGAAATVQGKLDEEVARAKAAEEANAAAAKKAQDEVDALELVVAEKAAQTDLDELSAYVGTIPESATATNVVAYVQEKTAGIATSENLQELANRVAQAETDIDNIEKDYLKAADKTELNEAIAAEKTRAEGIEGGLDTRLKAVEDDYLKAADKTELADAIAAEAETARAAEKANADAIKAIADDYLKAEDKTELQGNIDTNAEAIAAIKEDVDAFFKDADMTETAKETLKDIQTYISEHTAEAGEMVAAIEKNAGDISDVAGRMDTAEDKITVVEEKLATVEENAEVNIIETVKVNGVALTPDADRAVDVIVPTGALASKDKVAEADLETELATKLNAKADQTALEEAIEALEGADAGLAERLDDVEAMLGDGDNSVADMIATAKQEAIDAAATDATTKADKALEDAKKYADEEDAKIESTITELTTTVGTKAAQADLEALAGRVTTAEGEIDTLQTEMDAVEALAAANKAAHEANTAAIALKASQADLTAVSDRVTALETWHNNFTEVSEEEINSLFA